MNETKKNETKKNESKLNKPKFTGPKTRKSGGFKTKSITDSKFTFLKKDYEGATVYIGNLNYEKDELAVRDLFRKYGRVIRVKLVRDPKTNLKKGFGFAQMPNIKDATSAIKELNGKQLDGRTLKVSLASSNS